MKMSFTRSRLRKTFLRIGLASGLLVLALMVLDFNTLSWRQHQSVREFYLALAGRHFTAEGLAQTKTLVCSRRGSFRYFSSNAFSCEIQSTCGQTIEVNFFANHIEAFMVPDPFANWFVKTCPDMLNEASLKAIAPHVDQGG